MIRTASEGELIGAAMALIGIVFARLLWRLQRGSYTIAMR